MAIGTAVAVLSSELRFAGTLSAIRLTDASVRSVQVALTRDAVGPVHVTVRATENKINDLFDGFEKVKGVYKESRNKFLPNAVFSSVLRSTFAETSLITLASAEHRVTITR